MVLVILLAIVAGAAGYFYGRSTREADEEVTEEVTDTGITDTVEG